ncbi:MAG: hypothetical protein QOE14_387 [Humisphaera sp.]|nr:hypothetical protein [Humisphaera sp.]
MEFFKFVAALAIAISICASAAAAAIPNEQQRTWTTADGTVRIVMNTPGDFDPKKPTQLILFATPNGNSAEQTMGAKLEPGMDWHFDIQHVAAQVRKLRQIDPSQNIVVACLAADTKSWPAWRKARPDNGKPIRDIVAEVSRAVPGPAVRLTLTCHSGGGSFIFGYLNGGEAIPDNVERIAWLDANYGYDDQDKHGDKLLAWLKGDAKRHLVVIAYDDSQITLNGKPVLKTPMGGTFGSSHRMIDRFVKDEELSKATRGPFETYRGMDGQIQFLIHTNAEKKILHTVLVERNGLIEAMTLGTAVEGKWGGEFWGPRAYANLIAPAPATVPTTQATSAKVQATGIPDRPPNAPGGKSFAESISDLPPKARESAIVQEITRGNIPEFLRKFKTIRVDVCAYEVMPDYLAIGRDDDFVRMPMTPQSAKAIADAFGCSLPTRKMVNDIYAAADVKLEPKPLTKDRETIETFVQHNDIIEQQRAGKPLGQLVAGHKKDVVISNRLKEKPNRVAIYGWHKLDGKPIQPLYIGHADYYVDYSHGIRLVKKTISMDGKPREIEDVLRDPESSKLLSDEGPIGELSS